MIRSSGWRSRSQASARSASASTTKTAWLARTSGSGSPPKAPARPSRDAAPLVVGIGREERDLARARRHGVAVDGHARAVGAAVVELREHRAEVLAEVLGDHRRFGEEAGDSAHGGDSSVAPNHCQWVPAPQFRPIAMWVQSTSSNPSRRASHGAGMAWTVKRDEDRERDDAREQIARWAPPARRARRPAPRARRRSRASSTRRRARRGSSGCAGRAGSRSRP